MAGLFAARVLSHTFHRVTIVERDAFPHRPDFRKGVPQSRHQHVFLPRGREIAERLFPGLENQLITSGATLMDGAGDGVWLTPAGLAPRFRSGLQLLGCTRDLIEWTVRQRVTALANVRVLQRTDVARLLPASGGRLAGVEIRRRDQEESNSAEPLHADLVVDASGHHSQAPRWLRDLGYTPPDETVINAHPGYATRLYQRADDLDRDWTFVLLQTAPPAHNRGGFMMPVEGSRWMCTLLGMGGDHPPTDEEGFMAFARSLRDRTIHHAIESAEPVSPIHGYREIKNKRRHYEKLHGQPGNFLVIGDAACSFNPIYGQGMTTAALGAEVLEDCLRQHGTDDAHLSKRFQRKLAKVNAAPWLLATGEDLRVSGTEGSQAGLAVRLTHRYMDRVLSLSLRDLDTRRQLLEVFGMVAQPSTLFSPTVVTKVAREGLFGRRAAGAPSHPETTVADMESG